MMMPESQIIDELSSLIKLDIDAVHAYNQAIEETDVPTIRSQLMQHRDDHDRHVSSLTSIIRRLGGQPPEQSRDFKGFLMEGFTIVRSLTGIEGALKAMETNEKLIDKLYAEAVGKDWPADILNQLEKNYEDEQRHLQYIRQALTGRIWEPSETRFR